MFLLPRENLLRRWRKRGRLVVAADRLAALGGGVVLHRVERDMNTANPFSSCKLQFLYIPGKIQK